MNNENSPATFVIRVAKNPSTAQIIPAAPHR
jgi:hypothetical protein